MSARVIIALLLLAAKLSWSQVEPSGTGGAATTDNDSEMMTPPPVSGDAYPTTVGSEQRSNYLSASIALSGAYDNNVFPGSTAASVNDGTFSILPTFMLSQSTPRQQTTLSYSPSFLIYEPTTDLDTIDQGASLTYRYRFSQQLTLSLGDTFYRTSNVFDQSYTFSSGGITGSTQTPVATVIAPFAELMSNAVHGVVSYQFGRDGMIGASGSFWTTDYPNSSNSSGLSNSDGSGAAAFYNRRLSRSQYLGLQYQFSRTTTNGMNEQSAGLNEQSTTETNALLPFYTRYFGRTVSFSISGGIEHASVLVIQSSASTTSSSWSPEAEVSMGWQSTRANLAAYYAHVVTAGGGLIGAYNSNAFGVSAGYKLTRSWSVGLSANYSNSSTLSSQTSSYTGDGGTTIAGQAALSRMFGERFGVGFGYQRIHEDFSSIAAISEDPDSNQEYARFTYQFRKALGR
jgi:hypothetical protein